MKDYVKINTDEKEVLADYCQYTNCLCNQTYDISNVSKGVFLYPNEPLIISNTIEEAIKNFKRTRPNECWKTWKDFTTTGKIIFCEICKAIKHTDVVIADVTTLNFNLLFEIGFSLGLNKPVIPIRDTSYVRDIAMFDNLGLLDTLGYLDFQNTEELVQKISNINYSAPFNQFPTVNSELPLYLIKSHIQNDGMIKLLASINKSGLNLRIFDPIEAPRLSLHEAFKNIYSSHAVIAHLVDPNRRGSITHNSRCAFLCGMAMAAGKVVLMIQESEIAQPIDYRDVVKSYTIPSCIPNLLTPFIRNTVEQLQRTRPLPVPTPELQLETIDLGDPAAENEIASLNTYFVPTAQFKDAKRGHSRLVVGRKGSGKTAIFYSIRSAYKGISHLVLDLKPEGHQFIKLKECILQELSAGVSLHILIVFWNYLLLMEIAYKIIKNEERYIHDFKNKEAYDKVVQAYGEIDCAEEADFSERLLNLINDITQGYKNIENIKNSKEIIGLIYKQNIYELAESICDYLCISEKEDVWLLIDNLDKGWSISLDSSNTDDILILKALLEATRKIQRQFDTRHIEFHSIVFIRNDIYQHLLLDPADRKKDTCILLEWNDIEFFKEVIRKRISSSTDLDGTFNFIWQHFFESHIKEQDSFSYILGRTLMRPRELLHFTRECLNVAINRGHNIVFEDDILKAEETFSEDMLVDINYEIKDIDQDFTDLPYAFIGCKTILSKKEIIQILQNIDIPQNRLEGAIQLMLWFGFLGIHINDDEERFSYSYQHDPNLMTLGLREPLYCIHPAFRKVLGCVT
ncbi:MAG: P-loop ATPase, Sll1717 family [Peptococcaceae bacterium]